MFTVYIGNKPPTLRRLAPAGGVEGPPVPILLACTRTAELELYSNAPRIWDNHNMYMQCYMQVWCNISNAQGKCCELFEINGSLAAVL